MNARIAGNVPVRTQIHYHGCCCCRRSYYFESGFGRPERSRTFANRRNRAPRRVALASTERVMGQLQPRLVIVVGRRTRSPLGIFGTVGTLLVDPSICVVAAAAAAVAERSTRTTASCEDASVAPWRGKST